jgi:hypothetical protein
MRRREDLAMTQSEQDNFSFGTDADPDYEYETRIVQTHPSVLRSAFDKEDEERGYKRVWSDVTAKTTFIVYRKEKKQ